MDLRATWARISERWNLTGEDLRQAREINARYAEKHGQPLVAERFRAGELDHVPGVPIALEALRVGRLRGDEYLRLSGGEVTVEKA